MGMFNSMAFTTVQPIHTFSLNFKNIQNLEKSRHKISQKRNILLTKAMQTGTQNYDGVRIGPPPDLPSLLLHNRIVYMGMPLVPAVTELMVKTSDLRRRRLPLPTRCNTSNRRSRPSAL